MGTPSFRSLWRSSGLGKGAPVRVPPAGGPRPTRPSGLRADTLPTLCGGCAAARPVQPLQVWPGKCGGQGRACGASWSSWPPAVARGHPSAMQGQAPAGRAKGPALHCSSPAPVAAQVLRGGPAPTSGGCGAVRPSGPVGGAPASLASPATPTAQAVPLGSAYALAARRSGPGPLAGGAAPQPSRGPGCGLLLQPLPLRGAAIKTAARTGGASAAFPRIRARRGAGNAACGRECRPLPRPARPRQAPRRAASRPQAGALPASAPASDGQTWRVSRPVRASRPFSFW